MDSNEYPNLGIDIISDYKDDLVYRDRFNRLATLVFGIDFEEWYQQMDQ